MSKQKLTANNVIHDKKNLEAFAVDYHNAYMRLLQLSE